MTLLKHGSSEASLTCLQDQEFPARSVIAGASSRGWRTQRYVLGRTSAAVKAEPALRCGVDLQAWVSLPTLHS